MSESDGERAARSVALEQAYVHDVYEQCAEKTAQSKHWPRIYKFLEELEPGALVCDIGCGNGKYLSVNDNVFKVGADRCKRLTDIAREKENEVLMCDNLALPFRDESFDAVLSIAVVHHFATTERRVNALKELARVLRIGGRLVISVWAMEQRHRKFESQDVLVPWPKAYCLNSGLRTTRTCRTGDATGNSLDDVMNDLDPDRIARRCLVTSGKRAGGGGGGGDRPRCKNRSYWIDPIFSPSPSTSSLSSPNETCYSFFRRALQKLAGSKRGSAGNRAWFLETWHNGGCKNRRRRRNFEHDDIGDVDDIPIELRRLEDDNVTLTKHPTSPPQTSSETLGVKSKSLGDILEIQRLDLVRSRSSIPGFSSTQTSEFYLNEESKTPSPPPSMENNKKFMATGEVDSMDDPTTALVSVSSISSTSFTRSSSITSGNKPRLVKQKTHIPDDMSLEFIDEPPIVVVKDLAESQDTQRFASAPRRRRRGNVHKQSSMNEELMSMERIVERERVRKNIMKQASLNEEIMCKPSGRTFCHFRDSLYSGNATKRLQLIKSDLTNRIKQSTTSMENKVSSMAIKNGFVKILQGWKSTDDQNTRHDRDHDEPVVTNETSNNDESKTATSGKLSTSSNGGQASGVVGNKSAAPPEGGGESIERRLSKEDGSDSSKDSSLQSDTSVDSEDSFASVIYVPKNQLQQCDNQQQNKHHYHNPYHYHRQDSGNTRNNQFPSLIDVTTTIPPLPGGYHQLRTTSAPPSPRIKHPPDIHHGCGGIGSRVKLISMSPLIKQFPATSKSLPPPSPPGLSPRNFNPSFTPTTKPFFPVSDFFPNVPSEQSPVMATVTATTTTSMTPNDRENNDNIDNNETAANEFIKLPDDNEQVVVTESSNLPSPIVERTTINEEVNEEDEDNNCDNKSVESISNESINDQDTRRSRLNQIKELLRQKPGFATRAIKSSFPLVRRASTSAGRSDSSGIDARTLPRLLSLELFNPETDDLDSDSSGLSSPESVGSVISVISDQRFSLKNKKDAVKIEKPEVAIGNAQPVSEDVDETNEKEKNSTTVPNEIDNNSMALDITDKLGVNLINDIEQYCRQQSIRVVSPARTNSGEYTVRSIPPYVAETTIDLTSRISGLRTNCKYSQLVDDTIAWLSGSTGPPDNHYSQEYVRDNNENTIVENDVNQHTSLLPKSISEEAIGDFVVVTKNGECLVVDEALGDNNEDSTTRQNSINEDGQRVKKIDDSRDSIENSMSLLSDASQTDESLDAASRFFSGNGAGSTISLGSSSNFEYKTLRERRKYLYQKRSASEEIPRSGVANNADHEDPRATRVVNSSDGALTISGTTGRRPITSDIPLSGSSSQESLPSDRAGDDDDGGGGGGAITYHQYYHVFREGELDQLINKYVENLHIISSYYDHASWCIVAEKVQVWTI